MCSSRPGYCSTVDIGPEVANRFWEQLQQSGVRKEIAEF
jgi:hypothetical protein